jgi:flavin-dependent dehydrogenase
VKPKLDLIIVGGGPAGISTALHLQRHAPALAARTLVLEKERYPRDKYCAGAIASRAQHLLDALGVKVDVPSVNFDAIAIALPGTTLEVRHPGLGRIVRRVEFDEAFARIAMARGIEVREGAVVERVEASEDGVTVHLTSGDTLEARAVVGADGVGGPVRRTAGFARGALRAQVVECDTEPVDGDATRDTIHFDWWDHQLPGYAWDFPTVVAGRALMCRGIYLARLGGGVPDARTQLCAHLERKKLDPRAYKFKPFAERGFEPEEPISRPRVLLVGEAAGIDIITGEGIPQAIAYGAVAASYLAARFEDGDFGFGDWLAAVRRAGEGKRLRIRHLTYAAAFGRERPLGEKLLSRAPDLLRVGALDFGGKAIPRAALARMVGQVAPFLFRHGGGVLYRLLRDRAYA